MKILHSIGETQSCCHEWKQREKSVGFIPTMGALHQGHLSLVRQARLENDFVAVSVFVNPTQFAPNEDFSSYPRNFQQDQDLLQTEKVDLIFAPTVDEVYPQQHNHTTVEVSGPITAGLCSLARPTFFRGIATVVAKLFNIVQPTRAYFGQKDAQQLAMIKQMVFDLNFDFDVVGLPIVREKDGVAMSSRNAYLTLEQRKSARVLFQSLEMAKARILAGEKSVSYIVSEMKQMIESAPQAKSDYVEIVSSQTFETITTIQRKQQILIAIAVYVGGTRLIDNLQLQIS